MKPPPVPDRPQDEPKSPRSVLEILGAKSGLAPKVLLPDSDSVLGPSPVVPMLTLGATIAGYCAAIWSITLLSCVNV